MRNKEVLVTPSFEFRVEFFTMFITGLFQMRMKMNRIRFIQIVGGQVSPSSEPPLRPGFSFDFEVAIVKMHRGNVRVPGMDNAANP